MRVENAIICNTLSCPGRISIDANLREAGWRTEEDDGGAPTAKRRPDKHYCPDCPPIPEPRW